MRIMRAGESASVGGVFMIAGAQVFSEEGQVLRQLGVLFSCVQEGPRDLLERMGIQF